MEKTNCQTYFEIRGNIELDEISKILGIENTDGHSIGEKKTYGEGLFDWASWKYGTDYEETFEVAEQLERVIQPLLSRIDKLNYIKKNYDCDFIIYQVPIVENGETPSMGYSKTVIDFCSKTDTIIEIDMYVNPYKSNMDND
jgi:hypothetical protein